MHLEEHFWTSYFAMEISVYLNPLLVSLWVKFNLRRGLSYFDTNIQWWLSYFLLFVFLIEKVIGSKRMYWCISTPISAGIVNGCGHLTPKFQRWFMTLTNSLVTFLDIRTNGAQRIRRKPIFLVYFSHKEKEQDLINRNYQAGWILEPEIDNALLAFFVFSANQRRRKKKCWTSSWFCMSSLHSVLFQF